ncbi:hypothetical protein BFP72_00105 [Reichenbachiella sp. 5M10]|uniref:hypothetical protein n=1 Tax=Reichenbachiella sp. 5M10 TaxID=1889772 RepID=UPI000C154108|nr:hypothetical protein [Reichenbachiella sp. 5M10]PIB33946.1 hypothetical protein BFP72_00105 [Reichenbachiella sp. 5M10]
MIEIKVPSGYSELEKLEAPFKELSLAYRVEEAGVCQPMAVSGQRIYEGSVGIDRLIAELKAYYGDNYNCSCAR